MDYRFKVQREVQFGPCKTEDLVQKLGSEQDVSRALLALQREGVLDEFMGVWFMARTGAAKKAKYCKLVKLGRSFGFAAPIEGEGDYFVPGRSLKGAMPGDEVVLVPFDHPRMEGSEEGEIVAILEQKNRFVGTAQRMEGILKFVPDCAPQQAFPILRGCDAGARDGDKVLAEVALRGERHDAHRVIVAERFGSSELARECARALLVDREVDTEFPKKVMSEAKKLTGAVVKKEEMKGRTDLRDLPIFTIDSAHTMDIDDAISLSEDENGFHLGVHIADVSNYVKPGTELDNEAFLRGTSVYYADQVVPMLPPQLSNGICSLNERVERLAFSCLMDLDQNGLLVGYRFAKTVIRSRVKGVYDEINTIFAGEAAPELNEKYQAVSSQFPVMKKLYDLRKGLRRARGCMDIESHECELILDEEGRCVDVRRAQSGLSQEMIEEFMLLANESAARCAKEKELPFVYRVHEKPEGKKLEYLHKLLQELGINDHFAGEIPEPKELAAILNKSKGTNLERTLHTGILRSMQKARYDDEPLGHYSLVLEDYAHFTSPIRRYPDLAIHRILTDLVSGESKGKVRSKYANFAYKASRRASEREVNAVQVERDAQDFYKAEYARQHLGESCEGIISGVTQRGVFVELPNTVEGFVPAASLCETGTLLTEGVRLSDPVGGKEWTLGSSLMVTIVKADVNSGKVDFEPAAETAAE